MAQRRMAKIIRAPFLARQFGYEHVFPRDAKVVHIVRAPWDVLRSQKRLGWLNPSRVPAGQDVDEHFAASICNQALETHRAALMSHVPRESYLLLRYEDLVGDFDAQLQELFAFIDEPLTLQLVMQIKQVRARIAGHAQWNSLAPCQPITRRQVMKKEVISAPHRSNSMSDEQARSVMDRISACRMVAGYFGYDARATHRPAIDHDAPASPAPPHRRPHPRGTHRNNT